MVIAGIVPEAAAATAFLMGKWVHVDNYRECKGMQF